MFFHTGAKAIVKNLFESQLNASLCKLPFVPNYTSCIDPPGVYTYNIVN